MPLDAVTLDVSLRTPRHITPCYITPRAMPLFTPRCCRHDACCLRFHAIDDAAISLLRCRRERGFAADISAAFADAITLLPRHAFRLLPCRR